ncbi:MAG: C40 family peptidase [Muribaculaceae bacterium]|nr:C40 family peptidase [Muribaculaceae bacterium]
MSSTRLPDAVREITLDELVGSDASVDMVTVEDVISSKEAKALVKTARKWLGTPYKYGGDTRKGVDCSAMVMNVYNEALKIKLPRTTRTQREFATQVKKGDLQPGDLVFFSPGVKGKNISHVGMYIGSDRFIHASSSRGVVVSSLEEKYYRDHYHSGGRVVKKQTLLASTQPKSRGKVDKKKHDEELAAMQERLDQLLEQRLEQLDDILTATIDSIYSMPVDDDPNLAPGL